MRIVTINTGRNVGDYVPRIRLLARRLRDLAPDIVLAQEVFASEDGRYDTAADIAGALGLALATAPARRKPRSVDGTSLMSTSGLAVFSRLPIVSGEAVPLPTSDADGGRVVQIVRVRTGVRTLRLINLHLSFLGGAEGDAMRTRQWQAVEDRLTEHNLPTLVAGDFNAAPTAPLMRMLMGDSRFDFGPGIAASPSTSFGGLLPGAGAGEVLDYVFSADPAIRILSRDVALREIDPALATAPSDHAAVVVDVEFV